MAGSQAGSSWEFLKGQPGLTSAATQLTYPFRDGESLALPSTCVWVGESRNAPELRTGDGGSEQLLHGQLLSGPPGRVAMDREKVGEFGGAVTRNTGVLLWA